MVSKFLIGGFVLGLASTAALIATEGAAKADLFGISNQAANGGGLIQTLNLTTHTVVNSFVPTGAGDGNNGRGAQLFGGSNLVYYSELLSGFGPSDGIHVAPWNGGAGGADIRVFPNPVPGTGIVDLASDHAGHLFVMTGYPNGPEVVQETDGSGNNIGGPVTLHTLAGATLTASDGFAILPNGNWLINVGDLTQPYNEFNPANGNEIAGTTVFAHNAGGVCGSSTGVDYDPGSNHLFFNCNLNDMVENDLAGNLIASNPFSTGNFEDNSTDAGMVINPPGVPEPASLSIFGAALVAMGWARRRKRSV
jgi:hypothetical protein